MRLTRFEWVQRAMQKVKERKRPERIERTRRKMPSYSVHLPDGRTVEARAYTGSEARAHAKRSLGIKGRLPVGTKAVMAALLFVLALFAATNTAQADHFRRASNGLFWKVNAANVHDGHWYTFQHGQYVRHSQIAPQRTAVKYSANWKSDLVRAVNQQKDNQLFLQALRESGLQPEGSGYSYQQAAYSIYSQGDPYADQGGTVYGIESYAPNIGQVDIDGQLRQLGRLMERQIEGVTSAGNVLSGRIEQVSAAQAEIAKIQAAGAAVVEAVKAAQPARSETHVYQQQAASEASTGPPPQRQSALALVQADELLARSCGSCHGDEGAKGGLSLVGFADWTDAERAGVLPAILARVVSRDPEAMMPPPGKGHALTADELAVLFALR